MFKKRNVKTSTRKREPFLEDEKDAASDAERPQSEIPIEDLLALRKLKKSRLGIEMDRLAKGDARDKRRKTAEVSDEAQNGLQSAKRAREPEGDEDLDEDDEEAKARRLVRSNNFTQQTNKLDVDKHMMAYIEENMRAIRGETADSAGEDDAPYDPHAQLYHIEERYRVKNNNLEEGNVTNSSAMLTAIPEVDLGIDVRLKNIEETERAKRHVEDEKNARRETGEDGDAHLAATRFYNPRQASASDAEALRRAKLEAMGIPLPPPVRRNNDRKEMATDDMVMERFKKRMRK